MNQQPDWSAPLKAVSDDVEKLDEKVHGLDAQVQRHEWQLQVLGDQWETMQKRVDFNIEYVRKEIAEMKAETNKRERGNLMRSNATLVGVILSLVAIIAGFAMKL